MLTASNTSYLFVYFFVQQLLAAAWTAANGCQRRGFSDDSLSAAKTCVLFLFFVLLFIYSFIYFCYNNLLEGVFKPAAKSPWPFLVTVSSHSLLMVGLLERGLRKPPLKGFFRQFITDASFPAKNSFRGEPIFATKTISSCSDDFRIFI